MKTPRHRAAHDRIGTGGSIERALIQRWIDRKLKRDYIGNGWKVLVELQSWLHRQPQGFAARKGGLGRR